MVNDEELEEIVTRTKNATWELENADKSLVERIGEVIKSFNEWENALIERGSFFAILCNSVTEKDNG